MNIYIKSLFYLLIFSILHMGYDLTHCSFLIPFCGINESVFQHLKMAFWSYLFVNIIEYLIVKKKVERQRFWYSRLLSTIVVPWFVVLVWYLIPAIFGRIKVLILDIIWAVLSTYFSGVIAGIIEKNLEKNDVSRAFKIIVFILLIFSVFLYTRFTYKLPWIDLFVNPR